MKEGLSVAICSQDGGRVIRARPCAPIASLCWRQSASHFVGADVLPTTWSLLINAANVAIEMRLNAVLGQQVKIDARVAILPRKQHLGWGEHR